MTYESDRAAFTLDYPNSLKISQVVEYSNRHLPPKPSVRIELDAYRKADDVHVFTLVYWDGPVAAIGHSCRGQDNRGCAYIDNPLVDSFYSTSPYDTWHSMKHSYTFTRYGKDVVNSEVLNRILKSLSTDNRVMLREDTLNRCNPDGGTTLAAQHFEERWAPKDQVDQYIEDGLKDGRCIWKIKPNSQW